jgi:hypothetical protein
MNAKWHRFLMLSAAMLDPGQGLNTRNKKRQEANPTELDAEAEPERGTSNSKQRDTK